MKTFLVRILSFIIQSGGNAKTTSVACLGAALAKLGKRVLLIDFDPQSSLTDAFFSEDEIDVSIYNLFEKDMKREKEGLTPSQVILTYSKGDITLDLLPCSPEFYETELLLIGQHGRDFFLRKIIEQILKLDLYDFILIDCPPNLGSLTMNVLACHENNELMIPTKRGRKSKKGIQHLFSSLNLLQERGIAQFKDFRILITEFLENQEIDRETANFFETKFPNKVFDTRIRKNNAIDYAVEQGVDIFTYDSDSAIAKDYLNLAKEIIKMEVGHE